MIDFKSVYGNFNSHKIAVLYSSLFFLCNLVRSRFEWEYFPPTVSCRYLSIFNYASVKNLFPFIYIYLPHSFII